MKPRKSQPAPLNGARSTARRRHLAGVRRVLVRVGGAVGIGAVRRRIRPRRGRRGERRSKAGFNDATDEMVLIQGDESTRPGSGRRSTGTTRAQAAGTSTAVVSPSRHGAIAKDGHAALVNTKFRPATTETPTTGRSPAARRRRGRRRTPQSRRAVRQRQRRQGAGKGIQEDLQRAETTSLPVTLIILVSRSAPVAARVPLLLAATAVPATIGCGAAEPVCADRQPTSSVSLLVGLAVGVDYALFYLRREREERARGARGGRARGRGGDLRPGGAGLRRHRDGGDGRHVLHRRRDVRVVRDRHDLVVAMAMIGSLTVLPAILSKLGDRVKGPDPVPARRRSAPRASRGSGRAIVDRAAPAAGLGGRRGGC